MENKEASFASPFLQLSHNHFPFTFKKHLMQPILLQFSHSISSLAFDLQFGQKISIIIFSVFNLLLKRSYFLLRKT